jgi:hypothetical protein
MVVIADKMRDWRLGELFSRRFHERLVLFELIRKGTEVAALRALSTAVVLTAGELMLFAEIALAVQGVFSFGGRGRPAA